jgi:hypothetical protein
MECHIILGRDTWRDTSLAALMVIDVRIRNLGLTMASENILKVEVRGTITLTIPTPNG